LSKKAFSAVEECPSARATRTMAEKCPLFLVLNSLSNKSENDIICGFNNKHKGTYFLKKRLGSALIWNVFLLQKFSHSTEFAFSKLIVSLPIIRN
jgi:hypothetical protein